jgi:hypothetical protein
MSKIAGKWIGNIFEQEIPSGLVNGSNVSYTLANVPQANEAVMVFLNGLFQVYGTNFSVSGSTITFTSAPSVGQIVSVFYIKKA